MIVKNFINETRNTGIPAIHMAAMTGNTHSADLLLKHGLKWQQYIMFC